jgi:hypothetical protein
MNALLLLALLAVGDEPDGSPARKSFAIRVIDQATGRGVPLVELKTNDAARFFTDNAGLVAFDEPGLMGTEVYFSVKSHGYEVPADGFGNRGVRLRPIPGGESTIAIKRRNVAERLYRVTGGGLYRDSLLLGRPTPLRHPAISGLVLGQDSVVNGVCNSTLYWFWGDTNRPAYPLGNFHVPGATSKLSSQGGLDPDVGVDLDYFVDGDGFARPTAKLPGEGPTWIFGVVVLPGPDGRERMLGSYVKVRGFLTVYEHGAVEFDEAKRIWVKRATWPEGAPAYPGGQPTIVDGPDGRWVVFALDLPNLRVRADVDSYLDLTKYESFTPLGPGCSPTRPEIERDPTGRVLRGWKRNAPAMTADVQAGLLRAGALHQGEQTVVLRDVETGRPIRPHGSSLMWNPHRSAWSLIVLEAGGSSSYLGEVWYAEAERPEGPWIYARKVVTHEKYSFYNPRLHPYFAKDDGRVLYFEGTYTQTFSGNSDQTPRYDYNQIMYRLDLSDPRMNLPRPIAGLGLDREAERFCAPTRGGPGLVPVVETSGRLAVDPKAGPEARFFVLDDGAKGFDVALPLVEYDAGNGRFAYTTKGDRAEPNVKRTGRTFGRVWPFPPTTPR